jgi:hypothetical protein
MSAELISQIRPGMNLSAVLTIEGCHCVRVNAPVAEISAQGWVYLTNGVPDIWVSRSRWPGTGRRR